MSAVLEEKSDLPDGWKLKPIGEIVQPTRPRISPSEKPDLPFLGMDHIEANTMRMLASVPASTMKSSAVHFQPGDVLYGRLRPYLNKVLQPHFEGLCSAEFIVFPETDELDNKYLQYFLNSSRFVRHATSLNSGDRPRVKFEQLAPYQIPLPPTVDQQKRIVAKIEELFSHIDAGIEALKKAKQLLKQYRQSVLKAAVTGELTKEWRAANKDKLEPASQLLERILKERRQKWEEQQLEQFKAKGKMPKDDKWKVKYKDLSPVTEEEVESLPKLPDGWIYTRLGNAIDEPKYGTSKKCSYDIKGIGVLRIPNVAHGVIDSEDLKYAMFDDAEVETYKLNEGDILTIRSNGSINLVGKCALIDANDTKYLYAGYLIRLRPNSEVVDGSYLINALNSIQLRQQIESKAKSTSGVNNINSGELQSLVIPMCSKEEQAISIKLVDEKLSSSDRLLEELNIQQIKAENNKQSILASAFQGDIGGRI